MAQEFRNGFGSKTDAQKCHQPTVRKLVAHLNSNCKTLSAGDVVRRTEMIKILQAATDTLLAIDGDTVAERPAFGLDV